MRFQTLRAQLTLWYGALLFAIVLVFSTVLYGALSRALHRGVDQKLLALGEVVAESSVRNFLRPGFNDFGRLLQELFGVPSAGQFIQVLDLSGNVGSQSPNLERRRLPVSPEAFRKAVHGESAFETFPDTPSPIRILTYPVVVRGRVRNVVQVASSLASVHETLHKVRWLLALGIPTAMLVALGGGWLLAGRTLGPLTEVIRSLEELDAANLRARVPGSLGTLEVRDLAQNINGLMSRMEDSFRRVRQFTADASHELRTPLTVLRGEAEVALRQPRPVEEYQNVLASSLEEIQRMQRIVEDLLLLAKGDLGEAPVNKVPVDLPRFFHDLSGQVEMLAEAKGLEFTAVGGPPATVLADPLRLRQLFWNLLDNAVKYTPEGGEVYLSHAVAGDWARVTVKDTGIGIPPEHQARIFERFYRVDVHRARAQGGSGLGLAICHWIVDAHGGRIEVRSEPGQGSSFLVYLPLEPPGPA